MKKLIIYLDGASRGNPGPAGIGFIISNEKGRTILEVKEYIGNATNNAAEYKALIRALEEARKYRAKQNIFCLDSELLVNQIHGIYRTKNKNLLSLLQKVRKISKHLQNVEFQHISRERNKNADKLANIAINLAVL